MTENLRIALETAETALCDVLQDKLALIIDAFTAREAKDIVSDFVGGREIK